MVSFDGLDCHQQYFQTTLSTGMLGFAVLIFMFGSIFFKSIKNRNVLLFAFSLTYMFWGLTESMLERHQGVLFFIVFTFTKSIT